MVLLTITPTAKSAIEVYNQLEHKPAGTDDEPSLDDPQVGHPITHGQLIDVVRTLEMRHGEAQRTTNGIVGLEDVLRGSTVYVPPPKSKPEPSPEYVALMKRLREEEEKRVYERMINPPTPAEMSSKRFPGASTFGAAASVKSTVAVDDDETTYQDINRQMTLIINVLVTIIASSVTIWIAARYWSTPQRLALSMCGSVVIAIAEVGIYMGYIYRVKDAKSEEKRRKEAKEIVDTWVIDGKKRSNTSAVVAGGESMRFRKAKHR